jgi:hypothetical protein
MDAPPPPQLLVLRHLTASQSGGRRLPYRRRSMGALTPADYVPSRLSQDGPVSRSSQAHQRLQKQREVVYLRVGCPASGSATRTAAIPECSPAWVPPWLSPPSPAVLKRA